MLHTRTRLPLADGPLKRRKPEWAGLASGASINTLCNKIRLGDSAEDGPHMRPAVEAIKGSRTLAASRFRLPSEQVRYTVLGPVVWEALPNAKANIMTWMAAGDRAADDSLLVRCQATTLRCALPAGLNASRLSPRPEHLMH